MVERCSEMEFSLEGGEGYDRVDGVETFCYLVSPLYQTDDDFPDVRRYIMHAR